MIYYGFGRYGKNGKVTHHSVNDQLVQDQGHVETPNIPLMAGSSSGNGSRASHTTRAKDVPDFEKKKLAKIYADAKKKLPETLNTEFDELLTEVLGQPKIKPSHGFLAHSDGTIRNFKLRAFAAKEAHVRNGSVVQTERGFSVKLKESKDAQSNQNRVGISVQKIRESREFGDGRNPSHQTQSSGSGSGSTETSGNRSEIGSNNSNTKSKITLKEAKEKYQQIQEIDCGTEVGMSMSAGGESTSRSSLSTKAKELPFEGQAKKGISLSSFKSKKQ